MSSLKLYGAKISPCVRAVLMTVEAVGLSEKVELVPVDLFTGGHQTSEFISINPLGKVPVLQDGNLTVWDSHAINAYLVDQYGSDDGLNPKNPKKRALVDAMNHFDTGYLFAGHDALIKSIVTSPHPLKALDSQLVANLEQAYDLLEVILKNRDYVAGSQLTIADFSIAATLSSSGHYLPLNPGKHPKILKWYGKIRALPYFEKVNAEGLGQVKEVLSKKFTPK